MDNTRTRVEKGRVAETKYQLISPYFFYVPRVIAIDLEFAE
jgi:hypothetical protein